MNLNEVWAQGSEPGDTPISSVAVPPDPAVVAREAARAGIATFGLQPRPAGNGAMALLHDLIVALDLHQ